MSGMYDDNANDTLEEQKLEQNADSVSKVSSR